MKQQTTDVAKLAEEEYQFTLNMGAVTSENAAVVRERAAFITGYTTAQQSGLHWIDQQIKEYTEGYSSVSPNGKYDIAIIVRILREIKEHLLSESAPAESVEEINEYYRPTEVQEIENEIESVKEVAKSFAKWTSDASWLTLGGSVAPDVWVNDDTSKKEMTTDELYDFWYTNIHGNPQ